MSWGISRSQLEVDELPRVRVWLLMDQLIQSSTPCRSSSRSQKPAQCSCRRRLSPGVTTANGRARRFGEPLSGISLDHRGVSSGGTAHFNRSGSVDRTEHQRTWASGVPSSHQHAWSTSQPALAHRRSPKINFLIFFLLFICVLVVFARITSAEQTPLNYFLSVVWSLYAPIMVIGLIGAFSLRKQQRRGRKGLADTASVVPMTSGTESSTA